MDLYIIIILSKSILLNIFLLIVEQMQDRLSSYCQLLIQNITNDSY